MTSLLLYYKGDTYRVIYDAETLDIHEIFWFVTSSQAVPVEFDELEDELQYKIKQAVEA